MMSGTVGITLSVIDRMNLTDDEKKQLINELRTTMSTEEPKDIDSMTYEEKFMSDFEKWVIKNKVLYPPKGYK